MRELAKVYYSPTTCVYHYLHMAENNFREYLKGEEVWAKKYFYVLRSILAIQWIEAGFGVAPTAFGDLLERMIPSGQLKREIQNLIAMKREGDELANVPRNILIGGFIEAEMARLENYKAEYRVNPAPYELLDKIFQDGLDEVWA
jgi:hypothetical protein